MCCTNFIFVSKVVGWFKAYFLDVLLGVQYRMPDAYDQEGGVNQEKRFSVAVERYRSASFLFWTSNNDNNWHRLALPYIYFYMHGT